MLKTVAEFTFEYEAEIAKGRLEAEGIEAVITNVNSPYPGLQLGKHGIELKVHDYDLESAQLILDTPVPEEPVSGEPVFEDAPASEAAPTPEDAVAPDEA